MASNTQFSIAVHMLMAIHIHCEQQVTSAHIAGSLNTSPSFVRRILAKLSKANLVATTTGKNGFCSLAKRPQEITLLDIYKAVDSPPTFAIHNYPVQRQCIVSCNIEATMQRVLAKAQKAFEKSLQEMTLAEVIADIKCK